MTILHRAGFMGAIAFILAAILMNGCAGGGQTLTETGGQTLSGSVTTEYLLTKAGFEKLPVNDTFPKRQALLNSIAPGKLVTYFRDKEAYYAYGDPVSQTLYIGDEGAYQNYLALSKGRQLCERVPGSNSAAFWGCMQEYRERGGGR